MSQMMSRRSRRLLSSGADEPVSDGGGAGHSVFARAFITGLESMDRQAFSAADLYNEFIRHQVTGDSAQAPQFEAIQNSGHEGGDFVFLRQGADAENQTASPALDNPKSTTTPTP